MQEGDGHVAASAAIDASAVLMTGGAPASEPVKPRRRFLRFSLRTFFVVLTVACVWLGYLVDSARRQKASVVALRRLGASVVYDYRTPNAVRLVVRRGSASRDLGNWIPNDRSPIPKWFRAWVGEDLLYNVGIVHLGRGPRRETSKQATDEALRHVATFSHLTSLVLYGSQATDDDLKVISKLRHLEYLYVYGPTTVSDRGVEHLASLERLVSLYISQAQITDEALRVLGRLRQLEHLELPGNDFTDRGLGYLKNLRRLETLWVGGPDGPRIADEGLRSLEELPALRDLAVGQSQVTPAAFERLQRLKPGLRINR